MKNNKNSRDLDLTLIHPPALMAKSNYSTITQPPLGLAYLSAVVMEKGYTVEVVDAVGEAIGRFENWNENDEFIIQGLSINDVVESINPKTDFIGITCMFTHSWPMVRQLINLIREEFPEKLIIGGGEHITSMYELVMRETLLDGCVLGEGEETLLDILNAGADMGKWVDIKGFCFRSFDDDGSLVINPRRDRIRAVDDIPWPKWDLMNPMKYLDSKVYIGPSTGRTMPMLATRGCPYQCTFCSSPSMWTTRYWTRSPKDVVDEMVYYYEKYDATEFQFQDLTAIIKKKWIVKFCQELISRNLNITWQIPVGTRSEAIDQEVADLLIKSGCSYIQYAPESGSTRILQVIKKKVNLDNLMASVEATLGSSMQVCVLLIIGFPDETPEDIAATYRFIRRLALKGVHEIAVSCLVPLPGTAIFNDLKKDGYIVLNDDYCYWMSGATALTNVKSWNPAISDNRLRFLKLWGLTQFFLLSWILHPGRALKIVRNLFTGKQENKVDRVLREFIEKARILKYLKKQHSDSTISTTIE